MKKVRSYHASIPNERRIGLASGRVPTPNGHKTSLVSGQAMIMTVLALGGTMLGATTIAGLLMVYQIRQSTDMANSMKAIYAADAGLEWTLHNFFITASPLPSPAFVDAKSSVSSAMTCKDSGGVILDCATTPPIDIDRVEVRTIGRNGNVNRAFFINF